PTAGARAAPPGPPRLRGLTETTPPPDAAREDVVAGIARLRTLAGVDRPGAPPRREVGAALPPLRREAIKPIDAGLLEAFEQECAELVEVIEKLIIDLDGAGEPRAVIEALLRPYHTLKGAVSSIGMTPVGKELHRL